MRTKIVFWLAFACMILAYLSAWTANVINGLTMGAYDLADWLSKISMSDTRVFTTVLLLRGQLFLLTGLLAFGRQEPFFTVDWWLRFLVAVVLVIAQLPPVNLLGVIATDLNRQQQLILSSLSLTIWLLGQSGFLRERKTAMYLLLAGLALGTSIYALINCLRIMQPYSIHWSVGLGFIAYCSFWAIFGILAMWALWRLHSPNQFSTVYVSY